MFENYHCTSFPATHAAFFATSPLSINLILPSFQTPQCLPASLHFLSAWPTSFPLNQSYFSLPLLNSFHFPWPADQPANSLAGPAVHILIWLHACSSTVRSVTHYRCSRFSITLNLLPILHWLPRLACRLDIGNYFTEFDLLCVYWLRETDWRTDGQTDRHTEARAISPASLTEVIWNLLKHTLSSYIAYWTSDMAWEKIASLSQQVLVCLL